jgi:hypothetical protein
MVLQKVGQKDENLTTGLGQSQIRLQIMTYGKDY